MRYFFGKWGVFILAICGIALFLSPSDVSAFPREDCWKDTSHYAQTSDYNSIYHCCSNEMIVKRGLSIAHSERQNVCVNACNGLPDIHLTTEYAESFIKNCCTGGMHGITAVDDATRKWQARCNEARNAQKGIAGGTGTCPSGQSYTKKAIGVGPKPCGTDQCRVDGHLYYTACLTKTECTGGFMRGTTDGGNIAGCGKDGNTQLICCRTYKNRCNSASKDPNKIYLCTTDAECKNEGGTAKGVGFGCTGQFSTCCGLPDQPGKPMPIIGAPLIPDSALPRGSSGVGGVSEQNLATQRQKADRPYEQIDSFCFTKTECAEAGGTYDGGKGCPFKADKEQGYCIAPDAEYTMQNPIFGTSQISGLRDLISVVFNGSIGLLVVVSAIFFLWGAFKYLLSSIVSSIEKAKDIMVDSLVGLALGLGAFALVSNINPNLLNLNKVKIYMINTVSFYHVVYCDDLNNKDTKLMDAGTPFEPLGYHAQLKAEGYNTTISDAKCGREYFVEGTDSLGICAGQFCGEGGGICLNCSNSASGNCKSRSPNELACSDCKFGGTAVVGKRFDPDKAYLFLFCGYLDGAEMEFESLLLSETEIPAGESNKASTSGSAGWVTNVCFRQFDASQNQAKDFIDSCNSKKTLRSGMVMMAKVDKEASLTPAGIKSIHDKISNNPIESTLQAGAFAVGVVPAVFSILYESQMDNIYYPVNKTQCDTNLIETSIPFTKSFITELTSADEWGFEGILEDFYKFSYSGGSGSVFDEIFGEGKVWSFDEALDILNKGERQGCGFTINP